MTTTVKLTIFVAQLNATTQKLIDALLQGLRATYGEGSDINIVNVIDLPEKAIEHDVYVTPTVMRNVPEPMLKVLGDLSKVQEILTAIEIKEDDGDPAVVIV